jgi:hypothetical protein
MYSPKFKPTGSHRIKNIQKSHIGLICSEKGVPQMTRESFLDSNQLGALALFGRTSSLWSGQTPHVSSFSMVDEQRIGI